MKSPSPLTADLVLDRARAVAAIYVRARIEGGVRYTSGKSKAQWRALEKRLRAWAREHEQVFSRHERAGLDKPVGRWPEQRVIDASWRLEGLGMLIWACGLQRTLPAWDKVIAETTLGRLDTPSWFEGRPSLEELRRKVTLRSEEARNDARDIAELWHWRANTARAWTARSARIVADAAKAAHAQGMVGRPIAGDFPWRKKAYAVLEQDDADEASSMAVERHHALEWLTDERPTHASWDRVRTDT